MALIKNAKLKTTSGAYLRLFGDKDLGHLIGRVHSTVISSGVELEKIIKEKVKLIDNLDSFLEEDHKKEVFVADKKAVKKSKLKIDHEPDFLIFKDKHCYIVELKDGDTFDTKKATGEKNAMEKFKEKNGSKINWTMSIHFCCFNQTDRQQIIKGFKNQIEEKEALTGEEFCDLLKIDYGDIVEHRKQQEKENFRFFMSELLKIKSVKEWLEK